MRRAHRRRPGVLRRPRPRRDRHGRTSPEPALRTRDDRRARSAAEADDRPHPRALLHRRSGTGAWRATCWSPASRPASATPTGSGASCRCGGCRFGCPSGSGGSTAKELMFTSRRIGGRDAAAIGLVDRCVADDDLDRDRRGPGRRDRRATRAGTNRIVKALIADRAERRHAPTRSSTNGRFRTARPTTWPSGCVRRPMTTTPSVDPTASDRRLPRARTSWSRCSPTRSSPRVGTRGRRSATRPSWRDLRSELDNPTVVAALGAAGWVAPHFAVEHGGRGLERRRRPRRAERCWRRGRCRTCLAGRGSRWRRRRSGSGRPTTPSAGSSRRSSPARSGGASCSPNPAPGPTWPRSRPPRCATATSGSSTARRCGPRSGTSRRWRC